MEMGVGDIYIEELFNNEGARGIDAPAAQCRAGSSSSSRFCSLVVDRGHMCGASVDAVSRFVCASSTNAAGNAKQAAI